MPDPTLYLFDGYNLLHAGGYDDPRELVDQLASFVAEAGARGIVVFDGHGRTSAIGRLEIRYAEDADTLLERLAAEHRDREEVQLVSSDSAVRGTSGARGAEGRLEGLRARARHRRADRSSRRTGSQSGSTTRRGRSWNGSEEGRVQSKRTSEQKLCKEGCNFLDVPAKLPST